MSDTRWICAYSGPHGTAFAVEFSESGRWKGPRNFGVCISDDYDPIFDHVQIMFPSLWNQLCLKGRISILRVSYRC